MSDTAPPGRPSPPPRGTGAEENFPGSKYSDEDREFLQAIDRYKRLKRRPFPAWSEVLIVLRALGWRKDPPHTPGRRADDAGG